MWAWGRDGVILLEAKEHRRWSAHRPEGRRGSRNRVSSLAQKGPAPPTPWSWTSGPQKRAAVRSCCWNLQSAVLLTAAPGSQAAGVSLVVFTALPTLLEWGLHGARPPRTGRRGPLEFRQRHRLPNPQPALPPGHQAGRPELPWQLWRWHTGCPMGLDSRCACCTVIHGPFLSPSFLICQISRLRGVLFIFRNKCRTLFFLAEVCAQTRLKSCWPSWAQSYIFEVL